MLGVVEFRGLVKYDHEDGSCVRYDYPEEWFASEAPFAPRGVSQPHIPIMIGGNGEKRTLRTLARFGDVMNLDECPPDLVPHKLEVLKRHCDDAGRDFAAITKTAFFPVGLQEDEAKAGRSPAH